MDRTEVVRLEFYISEGQFCKSQIKPKTKRNVERQCQRRYVSIGANHPYQAAMSISQFRERSRRGWRVANADSIALLFRFPLGGTESSLMVDKPRWCVGGSLEQHTPTDCFFPCQLLPLNKTKERGGVSNASSS